MGHAVRATNLRRINGEFPADAIERAAERLGLTFYDNMATLINAALLAVADERVSADVLRDARERAPRRRGRPPRSRNDVPA